MAVSALYTHSSSTKTTSSTITGVVVSSGDALYVILQHNQKTAGAGKYATGVVWDVAGVNEALSLVGTGQVQQGKAAMEIWRLTNPTAKTATITITWVDNNANWNGSYHTAAVISGHDTVTPDDGFNSNGASSANATLAVATASGDFVLGGAISDNQPLTENGDGTEQWNASITKCEAAGVDHQATDAQSDLSWTLTTANWCTAGININVASAGVTADANLITVNVTPYAVNAIRKFKQALSLITVNINQYAVTAKRGITQALNLITVNINQYSVTAKLTIKGNANLITVNVTQYSVTAKRSITQALNLLTVNVTPYPVTISGIAEIVQLNSITVNVKLFAVAAIIWQRRVLIQGKSTITTKISGESTITEKISGESTITTRIQGKSKIN